MPNDMYVQLNVVYVHHIVASSFKLGQDLKNVKNYLLLCWRCSSNKSLRKSLNYKTYT